MVSPVAGVPVLVCVFAIEKTVTEVAASAMALFYPDVTPLYYGVPPSPRNPRNQNKGDNPLYVFWTFS